MLSTKQASKILKVSVSTVSRYFDQGLISGEKNLLTGRRKISEDSVKEFLQKYAPGLLNPKLEPELEKVEEPKQDKTSVAEEVKPVDEKTESN